MSLSPARLAPSIAALALVAQLVTSHVAHGSAPAAMNHGVSYSVTGVPCVLRSMQFTLTCYAPKNLERAVAIAGPTTLDPSRVVRELTGLRLRQVALYRRLLPNPSKQISSIGFLYGTFAPGPPAPDPSPVTPKWLVITEQLQHPARDKAIRIHRVVAQGNTTPAAGTFADWYLDEPLPHGHPYVHLQTNEPRPIVVRIGRALRLAARQEPP